MSKQSHMRRAAVLAPNGTPLMPTKASRARRWVKEGKAVEVPNDLRHYTVQLVDEPSGRATQTIAVGIDPGSHFSGVAVQSAKATLFMGHLVLPFKRVKARMKQRALLRRARRGRRINRSKPFDKRAHREKRFNNRRQNKLPPSIRANRELEYRVVSELRKLFPITTVIYEYVKARTTPGCGFSPVMVGQQQAIEWLSSDGRVETLLGWETSRLRKYLGLAKSRDKAVQMPESHAHDAIALAASHFVRFDRQVDTRSHGHVWKGSVEVTPAPFSVIQRPQLYRRQLHFENPARGGERKRKGGTVHHRDRNAGHNIRVECFPDSNKHAYPTGGVLNECGAGVDRRPAPCARRRLATKHCI